MEFESDLEDDPPPQTKKRQRVSFAGEHFQPGRCDNTQCTWLPQTYQVVAAAEGDPPRKKKRQRASFAGEYFQPGRCDNTQCALEFGHPGVCSHLLREGKRGGRK